ncbi:MAG: hypothetical protein HC794_01585 [Nitrospiraceae bacterium]|nr:hypothetical protein [Nitrospiraceae bacterium]
MSYVYVEYPKCLYLASGETITVESEEDEVARAKDGYLTAAQYHALPIEPEQGDAKKKKTK